MLRLVRSYCIINFTVNVESWDCNHWVPDNIAKLMEHMGFFLNSGTCLILNLSLSTLYSFSLSYELLLNVLIGKILWRCVIILSNWISHQLNIRSKYKISCEYMSIWVTSLQVNFQESILSIMVRSNWYQNRTLVGCYGGFKHPFYTSRF